MGVYNRHILPRCLDMACGVGPIEKQRAKVVPRARGHVVEIGIGSGLNLPFYDPAKVERVTGIDPDAHIWKRAQDRVASVPFPVERLGLSAEGLPLADGCADTVVCTYTLCTIPDPLAALGEMKRILAPGGAILFTEHGRAPDARVAKWQNRLEPAWKRLAGGCHMSRDIPALFRKAGLALTEAEEMYIPGPKILSYNYFGEARPAER